MRRNKVRVTTVLPQSNNSRSRLHTLLGQLYDGTLHPNHKLLLVKYKNLQIQEIINTVSQLRERVAERFPGSSLSAVSTDLLEIAENTQKRIGWFVKPLRNLRLTIWMTCTAIVVAAVVSLIHFGRLHGEIGLPEFVGLTDAGLNTFVLIGAAIFFLLSIETRYKRHRALNAISELRSIAHIIDMHQLTKDPERILSKRYVITESSPKIKMTQFELQRYLEYCSEMLSLTSKIGAAYVENFEDGVCISAASEIETLCTGLSRKIWQKILLLHTFKNQGESHSGSKLVP